MSNDAAEFIDALAHLADPLEKSRVYQSTSSDHLAINKTGDAWIEVEKGTYAAGKVTTAEIPAGCYRVSFQDPYGIIFIKQALVTDKLLRFNDSKESYVFNAISTFWQSKEKFAAKGQIFKRGVMLWGPAGSGKTSIIALLAEDIVKRNGIVLLCAAVSPQMVAQGLQTLRKIEADKPVIVVLEDIDEIITQWGERQLLSLLDGQDQVSNIVYLATTNFPERLGARLMARPSRFDEIVKVDMPTAEMRQTYFWNLLSAEELAEIDIDKWVADSDGLSLAALRELVVATRCLGRDYSETLTRLRELSKLKVAKPEFKAPGGAVGFAKN